VVASTGADTPNLAKGPRDVAGAGKAIGISSLRTHVIGVRTDPYQ